MQDLDSLNNLQTRDLQNIDVFIETCKTRNITEVALTGTNTDPMLYQHIGYLKQYLKERMDLQIFRITTNGVKILSKIDDWLLFDRGSVSFCSFDEAITENIMGGGVIDIAKIISITPFPLRINIVLTSYNYNKDLIHTIQKLSHMGITSINLREPYGQPNRKQQLNNLLSDFNIHYTHQVLGNNAFYWDKTEVVHWDVHYTEVESVNLYADGRISGDYCITLGHSPNGKVYPQNQFISEGRKFNQWLVNKKI